MVPHNLATEPTHPAPVKELFRQEHHYQRYARSAFDNSPSPSRPLFSMERAFFDYLDDVERFAGQLRNEATHREPNNALNSLEGRFKVLALELDSLTAASFDHHRIRPDVAFLLDVLRTQASTIRLLALEDRDDLACRRHIERYIEVCRAALKSKAIQVAWKAFDQRRRVNTSRCIGYFDALLEKHRELFVFRVDLYAPLSDIWWKLDDLRTAEAGVDRLLRSLTRGQVIESMLGYVLSRESGICRGMHYSLLVAQGGYLPRDGGEGATSVGKAWIGEFVDMRAISHVSKASFLNCYELRQPERFNEIGRVTRSQPRSRLALDAAIRGMWHKPIVFDAGQIRANKHKNPAGTLGPIKLRNLRKGKRP